MSGYCEMCGETVCVCADDPVIDWQSTCEMWKRAHDKVDKIACELQDICHKQAQRIAELEETLSKSSVYSNKYRLFDVPAYTRNPPIIPAEILVITIDRSQFIEMETSIAARDEEIKELKAVIRRNEMI